MEDLVKAAAPQLLALRGVATVNAAIWQKQVMLSGSATSTLLRAMWAALLSSARVADSSADNLIPAGTGDLDAPVIWSRW